MILKENFGFCGNGTFECSLAQLLSLKNVQYSMMNKVAIIYVL